MGKFEEIKDRAKCHDDTDIADRDWMITEIDRLRRKTAEMWAGTINRDTEIADNRQEIGRLKEELTEKDKILKDKGIIVESDYPKTWECKECNTTFSDREKGSGWKCWQGHILTKIEK